MKKVLWTLILFLSCTLIVNAASFSVSVGSKGLTKGGTTRLKICANDLTSRFNVKTSDASVINVSDGSVWVEKECNNEIVLTALKVGSATITVTPVGNPSDNNGNAVNLGSKSVSVSVALPREKSKNNNLKALSVEGYELSPAFDANTLEYSTTVPSTVDVIKINATKADNYASITGTGEFEIVEGNNEFNVVVTSETGVEKTYKVNVLVEDVNPIEVTANGKTYTLVKNIKSLTAPENYTETTVSISDTVIPAFYNENTKYTLVGLKDENGNIGLFIYDNGKYTSYREVKGELLTVAILDDEEVPSKDRLKGYIIKDITIGEEKVKAYFVSDNSKFAIVYGVNVATGEKGYFQYDLENKTISRYDEEAVLLLRSKGQTMSYIMLATSISSTIFFILTIALLFANSKKKKLINKYIDKKDNKEKEEKPIKKEKEKKEKKAKEEPVKEEPTTEVKDEKVSEETEVFDLFDEGKKKKKKSKK